MEMCEVPPNLIKDKQKDDLVMAMLRWHFVLSPHKWQAQEVLEKIKYFGYLTADTSIIPHLVMDFESVLKDINKGTVPVIISNHTCGRRVIHSLLVHEVPQEKYLYACLVVHQNF